MAVITKRIPHTLFSLYCMSYTAAFQIKVFTSLNFTRSTTGSSTKITPSASKSFLHLTTTTNTSSNIRNMSSFSQKIPTTTTTSSSLSSTSSNYNIGLSDIPSPPPQDEENENSNENDTTNFDSLSSWKEKLLISIAKSRKIRGGNYVQIATVDPKTMEPRCRTVVFRGFLSNNNINNSDAGSQDLEPLKMITDARSNKVMEASSSSSSLSSSSTTSNNVEMVWWFAKSSEQYRIRGRLQFIGPEEEKEEMEEAENKRYLQQARKEQWGNLSDLAREQFYWKFPGLPYPNHDDDDHGVDQPQTLPSGGRDEFGKVLPPPSNFLLMLLYPQRIDYLRLTDNFRQIDEWKDCISTSTSTGEASNGKSIGSSISDNGGWERKRVNP